MSGLDLSGEWAGVFSYPDALAPVTFSAVLVESDGWLRGEIRDENGLIAAIHGRRSGLSASWLKSYAEHDVSYHGALAADGAELSGRWSIYGSWSGPFLMLRKPQAARAQERRARTGVTKT